jgi:hypothetical protein
VGEFLPDRLYGKTGLQRQHCDGGFEPVETVGLERLKQRLGFSPSLHLAYLPHFLEKPPYCNTSLDCTLCCTTFTSKNCSPKASPIPFLGI